MLISLNGIPNIGKSFYAKLLVEQEGFKLFSFPMTKNIINDYKKHEHIIDSFLQIGQDVVIINNYFSMITNNLDKFSYDNINNKLSCLQVLPKLKSIDIFLIPNNIDNMLSPYTPYTDNRQQSTQVLKKLNNNYKMLYLIYFYIYNISPQLIEMDLTDIQYITKTWNKIKYIVESHRKKSSSL